MHQWRQSTLKYFLEFYPQYYSIPCEWTLIMPYFVFFYFVFKTFFHLPSSRSNSKRLQYPRYSSSLKPYLPVGSIYGLISPLYYLCDPFTCGKSLTVIIRTYMIHSYSSNRKKFSNGIMFMTYLSSLSIIILILNFFNSRGTITMDQDSWNRSFP